MISPFIESIPFQSSNAVKTWGWLIIFLPKLSPFSDKKKGDVNARKSHQK